MRPAPRATIGAAAEQPVEIETKVGHARVHQSRRSAPLVPSQRGHGSRRHAARDGASASGGPLPLRLDRSFGRPTSDQRRVVRGRGSGARADRHQPGRSLRVQRRRRRGNQGVSLPREWTDRGGDSPRRQGALGRDDGAGPAQPRSRGAREQGPLSWRVLLDGGRARNPAGTEAAGGGPGPRRRHPLGRARRHLLPLDGGAEDAGGLRGAAAVPDDAGCRGCAAQLPAPAATRTDHRRSGGSAAGDPVGSRAADARSRGRRLLRSEALPDAVQAPATSSRGPSAGAPSG